jgi:hypothetical protein
MPSGPVVKPVTHQGSAPQWRVIRKLQKRISVLIANCARRHSGASAFDNMSFDVIFARSMKGKINRNLFQA